MIRVTLALRLNSLILKSVRWIDIDMSIFHSSENIGIILYWWKRLCWINYWNSSLIIGKLREMFGVIGSCAVIGKIGRVFDEIGSVLCDKVVCGKGVAPVWDKKVVTSKGIGKKYSILYGGLPSLINIEPMSMVLYEDKIKISEDIYIKLKDLPSLTPILKKDIDRLKIDRLKIGSESSVDIKDLLNIYLKILDIKKSIYSIGLKDGFIVSTNLHEKYVYGVLSDHANVLIGEEFIRGIKVELEKSKKEWLEECSSDLKDKKRLKEWLEPVKKWGPKRVWFEKNKKKLSRVVWSEKDMKLFEECLEKCLKYRKEWLVKCLNDDKALYEEYRSTVLKDPLDILLYYNLLLELITVYLYEVSLYLSEMINIESKSIEKDLKVFQMKSDFKALSCFFYSRVSTSLRDKMKKVNPKVKKQVIASYDTEYKNISYGKNKLVSAQLSISGNIVIEIATRTPYEYDIIHTITQEKIKSERINHLEKLLMSTKSLEKYFEEVISSVRALKYGKFDNLMGTLVLKLKEDKSLSHSEDLRSKGLWLFKTSQIPKLRRLLLLDGENKTGLKWESLLGEIFEESGINEELEHELLVLQYKINDSYEIKDLPLINLDRDYEGYIMERELKKYKSTSLRINYKDKDYKDIVVKVKNETYLISHFNIADLSMIEDWDEVKKRNIDIIGKSYVSIKGSIKTKGYNVYIRDSMLLTSAAAQTLDKLGKMHNLVKGKLDEKEYIDMELFLKKDPVRFREYALNDSDIVLAHSVFVLNFAFKLGSSKIPCSLGSLSRLSLKKHWDSVGYKGYQVDPEYILGDPTKVCNPLGVNKLGIVGSAYNMFLGSYKGGRNEGLAYGRDKGGKYYDWDMTSCYTTVMYMLGNPNYRIARYLSMKELERLGDNELFNSYTVMLVEIKQKASVKFPIIPILARGEKTNWVYSREGVCYITGLEYIKLKHLNSDIKVLSCFYIPFESKKIEGKKVYINKPYSEFITYVQGQRLKFGKGSCEERMWKDIGNMCYGSAVTGLSNKMKYNPRTNQTERMVGNYMSNPIIGSWITAYVRCLIGESLNNINLLGGNIVSVTTDGFCVDLDIKRGLTCDTLNVEERMLDLGDVHNTFLLKAREARTALTSGIEGKEPNPSVWELKCSVEGITQWSTRGQCSHYKEGGTGIIAATTGLSRRNMDHKALSRLINSTFEGGKEISYVQRSLVGANLNYKTGAQCTPNLSVKSFKTKFDGRREVIIPEEVLKELPKRGLPINIMYETRPYKSAEESSLSRWVMNIYKQSHYVKYSTKLLPSTREYEDYNERSVIVDVLAKRRVDVTEKDPGSINYNKKVEIKLGIEDTIRSLAKFRAYRRRIEILNNKIEKIKEELFNIKKELLNNIGKDMLKKKLENIGKDMLKIKLEIEGSGLKLERIYEGELKRLRKLVATLKLYRLLDSIGLAGGEASLDLCKYLKISMLGRFLPSL